MTEQSKAPANGVTRKVTFTAWCRRCPRWNPEPRDFKYLAAFDLAAHNMDAHGGTPRGEE